MTLLLRENATVGHALSSQSTPGSLTRTQTTVAHLPHVQSAAGVRRWPECVEEESDSDDEFADDFAMGESDYNDDDF